MILAGERLYLLVCLMAFSRVAEDLAVHGGCGIYGILDGCKEGIAEFCPDGRTALLDYFLDALES